MSALHIRVTDVRSGTVVAESKAVEGLTVALSELSFEFTAPVSGTYRVEVILNDGKPFRYGQYIGGVTITAKGEGGQTLEMSGG